VITSTVLFSISDALAKHLTATLPPLEVAWLRYLVFCLLVVPAAVLWKPNRHALVTGRPGMQIVRAVAMVSSAIFFTFALKLLPIADATAISFAAPIFITALSIYVLRETVGAQRWIAAATGLVGVLIVIRPGSSVFSAAAILPLLSAGVWAYTVVLTRQMSGTETPATTLAWSALVGFSVLSALVPLQWVTPGLHHVVFGLLIGLAATLGQLAMIKAYADADASALAPFTYGQLIWSSAIGILAFEAVPGSWTLLGAAVIIGSGIYIAQVDRARA
jgi:drug/metabolite transporter (DMT)-like permease